MLLKLLLLFVMVPLVELALLLMLAQRTSAPTAWIIVVVTGVVGTILARSQGFRTLNRIRNEMSQGRLPTDSLVDAVMILLAGALLLTPGLLTDLFGLSLLIPLCRRYYRRLMKFWFKANVHVTSFSATATTQTGNDSQVIDSYVVPQDPEPQNTARIPKRE